MIAVLFVRVVFPLPSLDGRSISGALTDTAETPLGRTVGPGVAANPGRSGVHELRDPHGAFAARVLLARAAQRSLDVQYYIWHKDLSGTLLFQELRAAADRGVRVRLLLDDNVTAGLDPTLSALNAHPNIEVRLYNPFVIRSPRAIGYVTDFLRLNRRMHNKSFTADNQVTIVGGRNIGDEYFGAGDGLLFADLDVLAVGPAVGEVSRQFDLYWGSRSAYPAERSVPTVGTGELAQLAAEAARTGREPAARRYVEAIRDSSVFKQLSEQQLPLIWARTQLISDHPSKTLGRAEPKQLLVNRLQDILGDPDTGLALISGYFVPTDGGVYAFKAMARRGVRVSILTNALESTDVPIVYAGYADKRKALLRAGIQLYEMRRPARAGSPDRRIVGSGGSGSGSGTAIGGSATALHAKTFSVDRTRTFIGSFNFDPRSARLNTELGVVIDSPLLAARIDDAFDDDIPANAYKVELAENGELYWLEQRDGKSVRHDTEPGTTSFQRTLI
ncbi:MAG: phospholipase D family protein, partial [Sphingomonas bacterium]|nr:phospholipase D family protein [Sphingomonas bacterium]